MPACNTTVLMDWSISLRSKYDKGKLKFGHWKTGAFCVKIPLFPEKNQRCCGRFSNRDPLSPGSKVDEEFFRTQPSPDTRHSMIFPDKTEDRSYITKIHCHPMGTTKGFQMHVVYQSRQFWLQSWHRPFLIVSFRLQIQPNSSQLFKMTVVPTGPLFFVFWHRD